MPDFWALSDSFLSGTSWRLWKRFPQLWPCLDGIEMCLCWGGCCLIECSTPVLVFRCTASSSQGSSWPPEFLLRVPLLIAKVLASACGRVERPLVVLPLSTRGVPIFWSSCWPFKE
jgi:hypothetical protein